MECLITTSALWISYKLSMLSLWALIMNNMCLYCCQITNNILIAKYSFSSSSAISAQKLHRTQEPSPCHICLPWQEVSDVGSWMDLCRIFIIDKHSYTDYYLLCVRFLVYMVWIELYMWKWKPCPQWDWLEILKQALIVLWRLHT